MLRGTTHGAKGTTPAQTGGCSETLRGPEPMGSAKRRRLRRKRMYARKKWERDYSPAVRNAKEISEAVNAWTNRYYSGQLNQQFYNKLLMSTLGLIN
jgi:hypothetical protein